MLFSALMNNFVSRRLFPVGKEADSIALVAVFIIKVPSL